MSGFFTRRTDRYPFRLFLDFRDKSINSTFAVVQQRLEPWKLNEERQKQAKKKRHESHIRVKLYRQKQ
jgi:hypothetical protein